MSGLACLPAMAQADATGAVRFRALSGIPLGVAQV